LAKFKGEVIGSGLTGKEVYQKFVEIQTRGEKLDIIMLDYGLSITDGKEVCKRIREYEIRKGIKPHMIIMLCGYYDDKIRELLTDKNGPYMVNEIMKKPVFYEELVECLAKFYLPR